MPRTFRGTAGRDDVTGAANTENVFTGFGTGEDSLAGGNKDDTFGLAVDELIDIIDGRGGSDTLDYSAADRGVKVDLAGGSTWASFPGELQEVGNGWIVPQVSKQVTLFTNVENVTGSQYNDELYGSNGNNVIEGGAGADVIDGRGGIDTVSYAHSARGVSVDLKNGLAAGGDASGDVLANVENVIGSQYNDTFVSSREDNVFTGGNGADTFVFDRNHIGHDTITDFRSSGANQDVIRLRGIFDDWQDLREHMHRDGNDVVITIDDHNSIRLEDVSLNSLNDTDFQLV